MRYASITDRLQNLGSEKWAVHAAARRMKAEGKPVIELTIGEPDVPPDPALLAEATRAMHAGRYRYSNGRGEPAVVAALVRKYQKRRSDVTAENVLCFPGTQTALYCQLVIADDGCGIEIEDLPHIFERFYKGKNAGADSVGIGLALSKSVLNRENATVEVQSTVGVGTTFTIRFYRNII